MRCDNCKYWNEVYYELGECDRMKEKVQVDLVTGWEGAYLRTFETDHDFGCILFKEK